MAEQIPLPREKYEVAHMRQIVTTVQRAIDGLSPQDTATFAAVQVTSSTAGTPYAVAKWSAGVGSPEGAVLGRVGDFYTRVDGGANTTFYIKESGYKTNTGWAVYGSGSGNVSNTGTPVDNQVAIWTDATTIEGDTGLTFDGTNLTTTGFVTGLTFDATGDTAAGDNASVGYNSTDGLVLTGQGTTADVTIKNDAGATVWQLLTGVSEVDITGTLDVIHTSTRTDDHASEIEIDAAGFGGVVALLIEYDTGAISTGDDEVAVLINLNEIDATGGEVYGVEVLTTSGSADGTWAMKAGAEVGALKQDSGSFANPTTGTNNTASTDVPAMIDGSTGTNTTIFVNDNDYIIIGAATAFTEIEFVIETPAGNPGVNPTFGYSTAGSGQFTTFAPVDGTDGFRNTGVVAWDASDLVSHVANDDTGTYDIKITRTNNTKGNVSLFYAETAATTVYSWDKDGVVIVNTLEATGDTSAGDLAAMGYNSTDGLVLTGQGTTGDVTIKNDAGTTVWQLLNGTSEVDITGSFDVIHTSAQDDDHAVEIEIDAAGYGGVSGLLMEYVTGAIATGDVEAGILINIDETAATGGEVFGVEVLATSGSADATWANKAGAEVGVIKQDSGTFANPTTGTNNHPSTDTAAMIDGSTGTSTTIFVADNDYIIIGAAAAFTEMEFILQTVVDNPGITPTFQYSITGGDTWTTFAPLDGTNGFRNTGVVAWDANDLTGHVANSTTGTFDIKIIRTNNTKGNASLYYAKTAATTVYSWDKDGVVIVNTLEATGDTSAGDNAAMGYTAVEGLVLTGQGSTNDVTIKNDADAEVISIRTGTTDTDFEGALFLKEQAEASADVAGYGQIWVNTATPNELWWTDDAGTDTQLGVAGGGGDVSKVGTPVDNQVGVWTGDGTIEGDTGLTYDGTTFTAGTTVVGTFTSTGIDDNATAERLQLSDVQIQWGVAGADWVQAHIAGDRYHAISGGSGSGSGANILLYGATHATRANDVLIRGSTTVQAEYDDSASSWDFQANDITTTGTLGAGAATVTSLDAGSGVIKTTGTIELGHATDTTLSRPGAGRMQIEGNEVNQETLIIACSDETTALTTGTAKVTFRMPFALTLTDIRASVTTAPTGSIMIVDVNDGGTTIMSTNKLDIDAGEKTTETAATAPGLTDTALADDAEITIDIDQVGSSVAGAGLKVTLIGYR